MPGERLDGSGFRSKLCKWWSLHKRWGQVFGSKGAGKAQHDLSLQGPRLLPANVRLAAGSDVTSLEVPARHVYEKT